MSGQDPKDKRIEELEAEVAKLKDLLGKALARIAELEELLNKNSRNSSKPPSSDSPETKRVPKKPSGKKAGGQPGHEKHERVFLAPDKIFDVMPEACSCCGKKLHGVDPTPARHQIVELPKIKPEVTDFMLHSLTCEECGKVTFSGLPHGIPSRGFGPRLTGFVSLLSGKYRLSKRMIQSVVNDIINTPISLGTISNLEQETSDALAAPFNEAAAHVAEQRVVNMDESGWYEGRKDGRARRAWLWVATTSLVTVFNIAYSRSSAIAKSILGERFKGLLGTDRFSAYTWVDSKRRQLCWSHLKRDFESFVDRNDAGSEIGEKLLQETRRMFKRWHWHREKTIPITGFRILMRSVREQIISLLNEAAVCPSTKTANAAKRILKLKDALFTFVDTDEGIEPTNNVSERKIRHGVMWRKTSFGTQSSDGSRFVERILTVDSTLRQQNRDVLDFLSEAISARLNNTLAPSLLSA
jgi:transposase